jgi:hypothetical protein
MAGYAALTTRPKQNINDFLSNILPELLKQKMQLDQVRKQAEIWLQNQLKEYEAYGEIQAKQANEAFTRETLGKFVDPRYVEKLPMPALQLAKIMQQYWPAEKVSEVGINIPPGAEAELANAVASMTGLGSARQTLESFPAEQMAPLIRTFGEKPLLEVIDQIRTEKQKAAELGVRGKELEEAIKSRGLRAEELGVRKAEAETEKAGKEKLSQIRTRLEKKTGERDDLVDIFWGTGKSITTMAGENLKGQEKKVLINKIEDMSAEIRDLKNKLGVQPDPKYKTAADRLKATGIKPEDLLSNIPMESHKTGERKGLRDIMIDHGFDIFKILEAWK